MTEPVRDCRVRIEMHRHGRGAVWINGQKVPKARSFNITGGVDESNLVTIEVIPDSMVFDGPALVEVNCRPWGEISTDDCAPLQFVEYGVGAWCRYNEARL